MATYTQEIQDKANRMIALGTQMTFEAICEMYAKKQAKQSKSSGKKFDTRAKYANMVASENASAWLAEKNRENAMNSLPSSLR